MGVFFVFYLLFPKFSENVDAPSSKLEPTLLYVRRNRACSLIYNTHTYMFVSIFFWWRFNYIGIHIISSPLAIKQPLLKLLV